MLERGVWARVKNRPALLLEQLSYLSIGKDGIIDERGAALTERYKQKAEI